MPPPRIQHADPAARRHAILCLVAFTLLGLPLVWIADRQHGAWTEWLQRHANTIRANSWLVMATGFVAMGPVAVFALATWRLGGATLAAGRFPPPGRRTVRDVRVVEGAAARARGHVLQTLAAVLLAACCAVPVLAWRIVDAL